MKQLNIYFTDKEFAELVQKKKEMSGKVSWHSLIMRSVRQFKIKKLKGGVKNGKENL